jgi:hypothetical protein
MKVIGCAGQCANGKDELANYLAKKLNDNIVYKEDLWQRLGFAHAVKKVFMDSFGVTWDFIEEWKRKNEPPPGFDQNIRKCLQGIGDGFRKMKSNIWIEIALKEERNIIISDVRYLNEARAIRDKGGLNILVWRKGFENNDPNLSESQIKPTVDWFVKSGLEGDVRGHNLPGYSEEIYTSYSDFGDESWPVGVMQPNLFDFFIRNEGTLGDLHKKADKLISFIEEHFK